MTSIVENSVLGWSTKLGLGPLVARVPHPNRRAYAFSYGIWAVLLLAQTPLTVIVVWGGPTPQGQEPAPIRWGFVAVQGAVLTALGAFLAVRAVTSITQRAFYLYPAGYLATKSSGRVAVAVRWEDVTSVDGIDSEVQIRARVLAGRERVLYRINHLYGSPKPVKFGEIVGREVLAPLIQTLRLEAARRRGGVIS